MKIGTLQQNYTDKTTVTGVKKQDTQKDKVVLGQNKEDDLHLIQKPIGDKKAVEFTDSNLYKILFVGGAVTIMTGLIEAGRALGGTNGALAGMVVAAAGFGLCLTASTGADGKLSFY
jgi:hypothetical protein